jgi:Protein of unknown function (DUF1194)
VAALLFVQLICCLWAGAWPERAQAEPVDLEIVLAVDDSLSVSAAEFDLQVKELTTAFRDPRVFTAIRAAGDKGVAVSVVQWANLNEQHVAIEWTLVRDAASAEHLAQRIERMPRRFEGYGTAISAALRFCAGTFFANGFEGTRKVIDMSGDGSDNRGPLPDRARDIAVFAGITVNGLTIRNEEPNLEFYYVAHVIGGTGAFVMTAESYRDFADVFIRKLIQEVSQGPITQAPPQWSGEQLAGRR